MVRSAARARARESVHLLLQLRHVRLRGGDDGGRGGGPVRVVADTVGLQTEPRVLLLEPMQLRVLSSSRLAISCRNCSYWSSTTLARLSAGGDEGGVRFVGDVTRPAAVFADDAAISARRRSNSTFFDRSSASSAASASDCPENSPDVRGVSPAPAQPPSAFFSSWLGDSALCCIAARDACDQLRRLGVERVLDATILSVVRLEFLLHANDRLVALVQSSVNAIMMSRCFRSTALCRPTCARPSSASWRSASSSRIFPSYS